MTHRRKSCITLVTVILFLISTSAFAGTVYVKWDSPGPTFDGTSWDTAFHKVQEGLDAAVSGDDVWVAQGTYVENIALTDGVALYGGFTGTETALDQRDWKANETVLDGNRAGSVVTCQEATDPITRIDGFTITNGKTSFGGGGLYCYSSSPTIANNAITENSGGNNTGGILCYEASPTITNNTIMRNRNGGGIECRGSASSATIVGNVITGNIGAGVTCSQCSPIIDGNTIAQSSGSGIWCGDSSSAIVKNNIIVGNGAGGIYCYYNSSPTITNNTIVRNNSMFSGGIEVGNNSATVSNNIVAFNSSGIHNNGPNPLLIWNNCVYGNTDYDYSDRISGIGDISADPLFADIEHGNLHIQPESPCRDVGWDSAPGLPLVDIDGQTRSPDEVDIGADESDGTVWPEGPYAILRVSPTGDDANDGSSWSLAKRTVQAGMDAASLHGGEVWVRAGTYNERIELRVFAPVYGGFAGIETSRAERDWKANETILDGSASGSVVTARAGDRLCTIDGFTIRNGDRSYYDGESIPGGGLVCLGSSPTIMNNNITANVESGIFCSRASPLIKRNRIAGNKTAGVRLFYECSPTIEDNDIMGNGSPDWDGYGIDCMSFCSPIIRRNRIIANGFRWGTGIRAELDCTALIADNLIADNLGRGIISYCSAVTIANNIIARNDKGIYSGGGGIYCHSYSPIIVGNTIVGNTAGYGAGVLYFGYGTPTISNNIIAFNSSGLHYSGVDSPILGYNCIYGNTDYDYQNISAGEGDISLNPLFLDLENGDFRLRWDSPCVDAGANEGAPETDILGNPRPVDGDGDGVAVTDIGAYEYVPRSLDIDVLPGSDKNIIRLWGNRVVTVAVLGSEDFDVSTIDPQSVTFGPAHAVEPHGQTHPEDVNGDGIIDLLFHFRASETGLTAGDTIATLYARLNDGDRAMGSDDVAVVDR